MRYNKNIKAITIFILLLCIFLSFTFYANLHCHILSNGYLIVHGHPFSKTDQEKSPINPHSHSRSDLIYLSLDKLETVICFLFVITFLLTFITCLSKFFQRLVPNSSILILPALRAPPISIF